MELRNLLRTLMGGWWIVTISALAAVTIALASVLISTPVYQVTARLIVGPDKTLVPSQNLVDTLGTLDKRSIVDTYAEVLNSEHIYDDALQTLHLRPEDLKGYTRSAVVLQNANILELTVIGPDPQTAALLDNTLSQRGIAYIKGLYQPYDLSLLDPAVPSPTPYSPQPIRDIGLALVLGLAVGSVLALLSDQLQNATQVRASSPDQIPASYAKSYPQRR